MTKLTDTQLMLLSTASQRENGSLIPLPENLSASAAQVSKAAAGLIKMALVEEGEVQDAALAWRTEGEASYGARITETGRATLGLGDPPASEGPQPPAAVSAPQPKKQSKAGMVLGMLQRPEGSTLDELVRATGWLKHTTRAALTGLRKKGHEIEKSKRGDVTCYRMGAKA